MQTEKKSDIQQQATELFKKADEILSDIENANEKDLPKIYSALLKLRDNEGNTLLHYHTCLQNYPAIDALITIGANPLQSNALGYSPLILAASHYDLRALTIFVISTCKRPSVIATILGCSALQTGLYLSLPEIPSIVHLSVSFSIALTGYTFLHDALDSHTKQHLHNL